MNVYIAVYSVPNVFSFTQKVLMESHVAFKNLTSRQAGVLCRPQPSPDVRGRLGGGPGDTLILETRSPW